MNREGKRKHSEEEEEEEEVGNGEEGFKKEGNLEEEWCVRAKPCVWERE